MMHLSVDPVQMVWGSEKQMFENPLLIKGHLVFQLKMFERFSEFSIAFIEFNKFIWKERKLTSLISGKHEYNC